jgi:hypothetical protein
LGVGDSLLSGMAETSIAIDKEKWQGVDGLAFS